MARPELRWIVSFSASCIHAANAVAYKSSLTDPQLAAVLERPAQALHQEMELGGFSTFAGWQNLNAFSYQLENNRELARMAVRKSHGRANDEALIARLAGHVADLEAVVQQAVPQLMDELALRGRPIREQWEAYGPGLLAAVRRLTDERLIVESADVVLVHPVLGGGGAAHLVNNSVRLEGVLTNADPKLPETVRLAWLVSQLTHDLPLFGEMIPRPRLHAIAAWAMLPPALQAAAELGLTTWDQPQLDAAIRAWTMDHPDAINPAEQIWLWWETVQAAPTPWPTALRALDAMIFAQ